MRESERRRNFSLKSEACLVCAASPLWHPVRCVVLVPGSMVQTLDRCSDPPGHKYAAAGVPLCVL